MKNLAFFSSLLIILVLTACGGGDDTPAPGSEQRSFDMVFSGITVNANYQNVTPPSQSKQLVDVLSSTNKDKVSYVKGSETKMSNCSITMQGLQTGTSLKSVSVNLVDTQGRTVYTYNINLAVNIVDEKLKDDTTSCVSFLSNVANYLATNKSITLQIVLNGGDTDVNNLRVTVNIEAIFNW